MIDNKREKFVTEMQKKYGELSIFRMGKRPDITQIQALPTGSFALDNAIGVGGFPCGRIVEIFGPEAAGKSLLLLSTIAETQSRGGHAAFIDTEHALTPTFASLIGVDIGNLYYVQPDTGEQALAIMEDLISSCLFDIVGLDSVAAAVPEAELMGEIKDKSIAYQAQMMAKALRRLTSTISKTKTVAVFINQLREKPMVLFGSPEYTPGGRALKFYASLRIDVRMIEKEKDNKNKQTAHTVRCKIVKNKVAPPFSECNIRLDYKKGIDKVNDFLIVSIDDNIITQKGSWYHWRDQSWNGIVAMREYFQEPCHFKTLGLDIRSKQDTNDEQRTTKTQKDTKK